jgi:hypothetical protein
VTAPRSVLPRILVLAASLSAAGCTSRAYDDERPKYDGIALARPAVDLDALPSGNHLLAALADGDAETAAREASTTSMPFQARGLVNGLLTIAALGRIDLLDHVLAPDARFGLPDRREVGARPILTDARGDRGAGDHGAAFIKALRRAAARFDGGAQLNCPAHSPQMLPLPGMSQLLESGAEPLWCFYRQAAGPQVDLLVFRIDVIAGSGRIAYVGLYDAPPSEPMTTNTDYIGVAPPVVPPVTAASRQAAMQRMLPPGAAPGGPVGPGAGPMIVPIPREGGTAVPAPSAPAAPAPAAPAPAAP